SEPMTRNLLDQLGGYDLIYFSAVTLSIISLDARERFLAALERARSQGARIAFDTNYRPSGWSSGSAARAAIDVFLGQTDIILASFDDERAMRGDHAIESAMLL